MTIDILALIVAVFGFYISYTKGIIKTFVWCGFYFRRFDCCIKTITFPGKIAWEGHR